MTIAEKKNEDGYARAYTDGNNKYRHNKYYNISEELCNVRIKRL